MIKWVQVDKDRRCVGEGAGDRLPNSSYLDITAIDDGSDYVGRVQGVDGAWPVAAPPPPLTGAALRRDELVRRDPSEVSQAELVELVQILGRSL